MNAHKATAWKRSCTYNYLVVLSVCKVFSYIWTLIGVCFYWSSSCYHNFNVNLCSFSYSNCTGRGRGWPCCVPNYLRTFPKIATETSLLVRDCTWLSISVGLRVKICTDNNILFLQSHSLSFPPVFFSHLESFLSPFCQWLSLFLHVVFLYVKSYSPPLSSLFLSLCRWCHAGHSEKHRWLHQCKLHQCEFVPPHFSPSAFHQYLCILLIWGVVGGLFC